MGVATRLAVLAAVAAAVCIAGCGEPSKMGNSGPSAAPAPPKPVMPSRRSARRCRRLASPRGHDGWPGTRRHPYRSAQKLVRSLSPGQTGCLRRGRYRVGELTIARRRITLTSYPDRRRAVLVGRLRVTAPQITLSYLVLDGRNKRGLPSPTINADAVRFRGDDVSNRGTSSCFILGSRREVQHVVIARNRIHDCGRASLPLDHGIYMQNVDDARIHSNAIYDNASRGIKVGPDSQRALIRGNVIDGNAIGLSFSGNGSSASSDNLVEHNVVSNSRRAWNVKVFWVGSNRGQGNVLRRNCLFATNRDARYNERGGVESAQGFRAEGNVRANPRFLDRRAKNFRLRRKSRCRSVYPR